MAYDTSARKHFSTAPMNALAMHLGPLLSLGFLFRPRQESVLPADLDVGYWELTLTGGSSAGGDLVPGYVWHDVYATYSGTPDATVHCTYVRGPDTSANGDTLCDGEGAASFRYEWNAAAGFQSEIMIQTLTG